MKITIDRTYTEDHMIPRTKAQIAEFKEAYTPSDLLWEFARVMPQYESLTYGYDIIRCNLSAFPGGSAETDETHYSVDILLERHDEFVKVHFFISQSFDVNTRTVYYPGCDPMPMWDVKHFKGC